MGWHSASLNAGAQTLLPAPPVFILPLFPIRGIPVLLSLAMSAFVYLHFLPLEQLRVLT